jgi:hypothetical protein
MNTEEFVGKKITFKDEKGEKYEGICESINSNHFFTSWGTVVTFEDRTPVTNVDVNTIKLIK